MLEVIAIIVYSANIIALARSRGRSPWWVVAGLAAWAMGHGIGWVLAPTDPLLAATIGLPLAVVSAAVVYWHVYQLEAHERPTGPNYGRGNNFPCPCCASLQTEDRSGHLACHGCGAAFGY